MRCDASRAFSYFSAFDAPWRTSDFNPAPGAHPEEAFWGCSPSAHAEAGDGGYAVLVR